MNKELEALLLRAAKAMRLGVVGVDPKRAHEFGVPVGTLVREGETIQGGSKKAKTTGYYCPRSSPLGAPKECLAIQANSPGDGWTRYQVIRLRETSTGHWTLQWGVLRLGECKEYLRGLEQGAEATQEKGR